MPVWLYIVLAVVAVVATFASTPLILHVLNRPKVKLLDQLEAYWSVSTVEGERRIYIGVLLAARNDGSEESHLHDLKLRALSYALIRGPKPDSFDTELVAEITDNKIERNGGELRREVVFSTGWPPGYKRVPHQRKFDDHFAKGIPLRCELTARPSQNRRLLWGVAQVKTKLSAIWLNWDEFRPWAEEHAPNLPEAGETRW